MKIFLHGLESSSRGAKATFLRDLFPDMVIPDFTGSLSDRMKHLESLLAGEKNIRIVGSSFGGLMATIYAMKRESEVYSLVLLAPALNFPEFAGYGIKKIATPVRMIIGRKDNVTPPEKVLSLARKIFTDLTYEEVEDDHMLAGTFRGFDWQGFMTA